MNILITGAAGYLGSKLSWQLSKDDNVISVDNLLFNQGALTYQALRNTEFHNKSVPDLDINFDTINVCFPLSHLTGMPICKTNPMLAQQTNKEDILELIDKLPQDCKIISPCSNSGYGTQEGVCDESTPFNSVSLYGKLKEEVETAIIERGNAISFRLATVFGWSFRPRLDLLVNWLTYQAYFEGKLDIYNDNFQRNYVHIQDVINGMIFGLDNFAEMKDNIYNLGHDELNCSKGMLADTIAEFFPTLPINHIQGNDPDVRNYRVSSAKLYKAGFRPQYDLDYGINELINYYSYLPKDPQARELVTQPMRNDKFLAE